MDKKYELTSETIVIFGRTLYRIRALISFGDIEKNELGGFVEKEENIDQSGDAWVYGDAMVYGNAWVYGDAEVYGDAWVHKATHLFQLGVIGSRNSFTTFFRAKTNKIMVACGCFLGDTEEFAEAVTKTHAGTRHEKNLHAGN